MQDGSTHGASVLEKVGWIHYGLDWIGLDVIVDTIEREADVPALDFGRNQPKEIPLEVGSIKLVEKDTVYNTFKNGSRIRK